MWSTVISEHGCRCNFVVKFQFQVLACSLVVSWAGIECSLRCLLLWGILVPHMLLDPAPAYKACDTDAGISCLALCTVSALPISATLCV